MNSNFAIAIHGGAGTILKSKMTNELEMDYKDALTHSLSKAYSILSSGGSSVEAVEAAVMAMEDNPLFNAGKGAVYNHEGKHEMDAAIMDGFNRNAGAIAGVSHIKNPIRLAKEIMQDGRHVMLCGEGAESFARIHNLEFCEDAYFDTDLRYKQWQESLVENDLLLDHSSNKFGTVGAVALDKYGNLAAATSTGGMTNKRFGRVGDSPIIGAGTYAYNKTCAVSCTGHGELFIRSVVAYDISCLMEYKWMPLENACNLVVYEKLVEINGEGGLIAIDKNGNICMPFNSEGMYRGYKKSDGSFEVKIYKD